MACTSCTEKETYFQLVKYPVQAAAQMNNKLLTAQLARHGKADWADSDRAYDSIVSLTKRYNTTKWNRMMDFQPRRLPVFNRVERKVLSSGLPEKRQAVYTWNGADCVNSSPVVCEGLGYEGKAVAVSKNKELTFEFTAWETDSVEVEVRLLPNHPVEGERLRFTIHWMEVPRRLFRMKPKDAVKNGRRMFCVIRLSDGWFFLLHGKLPIV